jgi:hypothetical protein
VNLDLLVCLEKLPIQEQLVNKEILVKREQLGSLEPLVTQAKQEQLVTLE